MPNLDWDVIHPNDTVVLRGGFDDEHFRLLVPTFELLAQEKGVVFFILPKETEFTFLSEEQMNQAGWYRHE